MRINKVIGVVGFPKSGNTWASRLVRHITNGSIYVEKDDLSPSVDSSEIDGPEDVLVVKRHDSDVEGFCNYLVGQGIVADQISYVYVKRDLRDVVLSAFSFNYPYLHKYRNKFLIRPFLAFETKCLAKCWCGPFWVRYFRKMVEPLLDNPHYVGSWDSHIRNWSFNQNTIYIDYEKLLANPLSEITRLSSYLGMSHPQSFLDEVIETQSFSSRKKEFVIAGDKINTQFLRKGAAGYWKDELPESTANFIMRRSRDLL